MTRAILVTGASRGIGRAAAEALARSGWSVIGVARRAPEAFPGEFIEVDLGDPAADRPRPARRSRGRPRHRVPRS